jgi:N-succinyldiaminopimelate aminotransferase
MRIPHLSARLQGFGTNVFAEMSALAAEHDAVNLGQGFPDFDGPDELLEAARQAIRDGRNQYAPLAGVPELRRAVARHQSRFWGIGADPDTEVTVTAGASEALCAAIQGLCDPGDEVVVFDPCFDTYPANIAMAGAVARPVRLHEPDFRFDPAELDAAVTARTRLILVNTPHNPTGKVFRRDELELIARIAIERDVVVVTDEVYEHLVFDGEHVPIAALPGMAERTITVSSAAKTFSATGWKVGWAVAPPPLTTALRATKQFITFTNATPFQYAVAQALELPDGYYAALRDAYRARRDRLVAGLAEAGLAPRSPEGSYFVATDIGRLGFDDDLALCRSLPARVGVAAIPCSVFYVERPVRHLVRFAFCKSDAVLDEGIARLRTLRGRT